MIATSFYTENTIIQFIGHDSKDGFESSTWLCRGRVGQKVPFGSIKNEENKLQIPPWVQVD